MIENLSAVTGACLMAKTRIYEEVNWMDESLAVAFNDVDFCLKLQEYLFKDKHTRGVKNKIFTLYVVIDRF